MNRAIIPEIIRPTQKDQTQPQKTLNVNLTNKYDNRNIYDIHNTYTTTTNTTINNKKGGLYRFLIDVILLPYKMIKTIWLHFYKKYDLKDKWRIESKKAKLDNWARRYAKKNRGLYDMEELY